MKLLRVSPLIIIVCFIVLTVYGRQLFVHVDYIDYMRSSRHGQIFDYEDLDIFQGIEDIFTPVDNISSLEDLMRASDQVLKVTSAEEPIFYGNGVLFECEVTDVIQSENFQPGDRVMIYEPIMMVNMISAVYLGPAVPLRPNESYYVFLNPAPNPNIDNTYIYSSLEFGHILSDGNYTELLEYENYSLTVGESSAYAYLGTDERVRTLYQQIRDELIN